MIPDECLIDDSIDSSQQNTDQSTEYLRQEIVCLRDTLERLQKDCSALRCTLISNSKPNQFEALSNSSFVDLELRSRRARMPSPLESAESMSKMAQLKKEREMLQKRVDEITEDNNEVYETLQRVTEEKEHLRSQLDDLKEELDTCKTVARFLELEGNQLKNEVMEQDKKLEEYRRIYSSMRNQSANDMHTYLVSLQTTSINQKLPSMT